MITLKDLEETFEVHMSEARIRAFLLHGSDKPARREYLNNYADGLIRNFKHNVLKEDFSPDNMPNDLPKHLLEEIQERIEEEMEEVGLFEYVDIDKIYQEEISSHLDWFIEERISNLACVIELTQEEEKQFLDKVVQLNKRLKQLESKQN